MFVIYHLKIILSANLSHDKLLIYPICEPRTPRWNKPPGVPIEQMAIFVGMVRCAHFSAEPAKRLPNIKVALVNDDGYTIDA